ncbi:reverse transcriptase [Phytophthora megakarya]|uniref:Reverse transcriptase n=1 Tax=Phytophthora megakarya TaxID=4795 RepID=A0A225V2U8_9STRA|nr:reverse transcriptase [Phytophthora megakarya]
MDHADEYLSEIKTFPKEDFQTFSPRRLRKIAKLADLFALDTRDLARLGIAHVNFSVNLDLSFQMHFETTPNTMDMKISKEVIKWIDCTRGKGKPPNAEQSPGNIDPGQPFKVISMDFVTHMLKSDRGNTSLFIFQDMVSGYKPIDSTMAQDVAEACEERVFRNVGASSMIRHDQGPRFMSEVFTRFRELLNSRQSPTLEYRPQANRQQERSVRTVVKSIRAYIEQPGQTNWDDHAKRLIFALNTSFDATSLDTRVYLIHGWDPQSTLKAMLGSTPSSVPEHTAYEWRRKVQRNYGYAKTFTEALHNEARRHRSDIQTRRWK